MIEYPHFTYLLPVLQKNITNHIWVVHKIELSGILGGYFNFLSPPSLTFQAFSMSQSHPHFYYIQSQKMTGLCTLPVVEGTHLSLLLSILISLGVLTLAHSLRKCKLLVKLFSSHPSSSSLCPSRRRYSQHPSSWPCMVPLISPSSLPCPTCFSQRGTSLSTCSNHSAPKHPSLLWQVPLVPLFHLGPHLFLPISHTCASSGLLFP